MIRNVDTTHHTDNSDRNCRITEILADGVYEYMKNNGLLKADSKRNEAITRLLDQNRRVLNSEENMPLSC